MEAWFWPSTLSTLLPCSIDIFWLVENRLKLTTSIHQKGPKMMKWEKPLMRAYPKYSKLRIEEAKSWHLRLTWDILLRRERIKNHHSQQHQAQKDPKLKLIQVLWTILILKGSESQRKAISTQRAFYPRIQIEVTTSKRAISHLRIRKNR